MGDLWLDLASIDLEQEVIPLATLRDYLPQRHEFELIDRVSHVQLDPPMVVAYRDFGTGDWWARGHFPIRPLVPGVLMVECAAQAATVLWRQLEPGLDTVVGFGGLEAVRFRGQVEPPARIVFIATAGQRRSRMGRFPVQAVVDNKLVFEGTIIGVAI
jgi:3-hydroxyacyl-[acyl-carrier-protein] dehydratase